MDKKDFLKKDPCRIKDMYVAKGCVTFWEDPDCGDESELKVTLSWKNSLHDSDFWDVPTKCELDCWLESEGL